VGNRCWVIQYVSRILWKPAAILLSHGLALFLVLRQTFSHLRLDLPSSPFHSFSCNPNPLWHLFTLPCLPKPYLSHPPWFDDVIKILRKTKFKESLIMAITPPPLNFLPLCTLFVTTLSPSLWEVKFHLKHTKITVLCALILIFLDSEIWFLHPVVRHIDENWRNIPSNTILFIWLLNNFCYMFRPFGNHW
jgi:hypothetical protein